MSLLLMMALTFVSGTALAAAMCAHPDAQAHIAALHGEDDTEAFHAQSEETAAQSVSKMGTLGDAGSFSLAAFILPDPLGLSGWIAADPAPVRPPDAAKLARSSWPPLLEPPAA